MDLLIQFWLEQVKGQGQGKVKYTKSFFCYNFLIIGRTVMKFFVHAQELKPHQLAISNFVLDLDL